MKMECGLGRREIPQGLRASIFLVDFPTKKDEETRKFKLLLGKTGKPVGCCGFNSESLEDLALQWVTEEKPFFVVFLLPQGLTASLTFCG